MPIPAISTLAADATPALLTAMPIALVLAGAALLAVWGISRVRPDAFARLSRRGSDPSGRPAELTELGADLEELAERLAAMLDEKAARVERLIGAADERLAALERGGERVERPEVRVVATEFAGARAPAGFVAARDMEPDPLHREIFRLADDGRSPAEIAKALDEQIGKVQLILALRAP
ncbi:MAG: hypothetical protein IBJ10_02490 [Phycisphaerales bacterium]|nr:hypothetical protein [Phycisphaerales bacterium]